jgi:hypothetical protein
MRISIIAVCGLSLAGCAGAGWPQPTQHQALENESVHVASWLTPQNGAASQPALHATPVARIAPAEDAKVLEPAAPAGEPDQLCEASARQDADHNWFDEQTRARVYTLRLAQCRALLAQQPPFN